MFHDHGLLLDAILSQGFVRHDPIGIATEWMPAHPQADALLMLPDVREFVHEEGLKPFRRVREIRTPQPPVRMEPDMPVGGHRNIVGLEGKPLSTMDPDEIGVQREPKYLRRKRALSLCQWPTGIAPKPAQ